MVGEIEIKLSGVLQMHNFELRIAPAAGDAMAPVGGGSAGM
jgi:hypothetical protein